MKRGYRVRIAPKGTWIWCESEYDLANAITAAIGEGNVGDSCTVEVAEMEESERDNLRDFEGF